MTGISTTKGSTVLQANDYAWQSNRILQNRVSTVGSQQRKETFSYDAQDRLTTAETYINTSNTRDLSYQYNQLGNLAESTSSLSDDLDVTSYSYGAGAAGPNAVTSVTIGGHAYTLTYDANGAITEYNAPGSLPDTTITYNASNQPTGIFVGGSAQVWDSFLYDPDGNRVYRHTSWLDGSSTLREEESFYVGRNELTYFTNDPSVLGVIRTQIGPNIAVLSAIDVNFSFSTRYHYVHRDHLGSIEKETDEFGDEVRTMTFEPFGTRKASNWQSNIGSSELTDLLTNFDDPFSDFVSERVVRGFTDHQHLDRTGFIHMNGRLYDPRIGRFLSPDPIVQVPTNSQSWNGYSYTLNSPLSFIDPTGLGPEGDDNELVVPGTHLNGCGWFQDSTGTNVLYIPCETDADIFSLLRFFDNFSVYIVNQFDYVLTYYGGGGTGQYPPADLSEGDNKHACTRDADLERFVRGNPRSGNLVLYDGAYPAMAKTFDVALAVAFSGASTYVADFRTNSVHEFTGASIGVGPRAALWAGRATGTFYAYKSDQGKASFDFDLDIMGRVGPVGGGGEFSGLGVIPGGTIMKRGGVGLIDAGISLAANLSTYVRAWDPKDLPRDILKWFTSEWNKYCGAGYSGHQ